MSEFDCYNATSRVVLLPQPSTQAFSSRSHDLGRFFVTSPNGIPGTSFGDVTTFRTKSSRVSGRRKPGYYAAVATHIKFLISSRHLFVNFLMVSV